MLSTDQLKTNFIALIFFFSITMLGFAQKKTDTLFEDQLFEKKSGDNIFFESDKVDFIQIASSITDSVRFAIAVYKPEKPSPILLISHGWHMGVKPPSKNADNIYPGFITVQVDMRGRKYSTGKQDCNGFELYDFYDAYKYVVANYPELITDKEQVYYFGGSGGGGNGYGLIGKFPDLFCSAVIYCGMSDYALWFDNDEVGEFRDEMIPWIGCTPQENKEAYDSRSGITTVGNLLSPLYIVHGGTDIRVPAVHARNYVAKANKYKKEVHYLELENVGTRSHWGNITEMQQEKKDSIQILGFITHSNISIPVKGQFVVAGYLVTKHFSVFMDSIDEVGKIKYDLNKRNIKFLEGSGKVTWKN